MKEEMKEEIKKSSSLKDKLEKASKDGLRRVDLSSEERKEIEAEKGFISIDVYQNDESCKKNEFGKHLNMKLIEK